MSFVANGYLGTDTQDHPGRLRFLSDNSFQLRYFRRAGWRSLSMAAFSITADLGFENGDGVSAFGGSDGPAQYFAGFMIYNRLWFLRDLLAPTVGGGYVNNPGRSLVITPPGQAATVFTENPGDPFAAWDLSGTFDYMPNQFITYRFECVRRVSNV